jgi:hypothetical protein
VPFPLIASRSSDSDVGRCAQSARELCHVVLDVADADDLMLELGDPVPAEAARRIIQIHAIDAWVDHVIAATPIGQDL